MIVGLTGSIATGKSTVSRMLQEAGIPVVDADIAARQVVEKGTPILKKIEKTFGKEVIQADGTLDRAALGARIFEDEEARKQLNAITHPAIREWMDVERRRLEEQQHPVIVLDIPLLVENQLVDTVDEVIVVSVDEQTQCERLMKRDQLSKEEAQERIITQLPVKEKERHATYVIDNRHSERETLKQVNAILKTWSSRLL